jgi:hypothetical protein
MTVTNVMGNRRSINAFDHGCVATEQDIHGVIDAQTSDRPGVKRQQMTIQSFDSGDRLQSSCTYFVTRQPRDHGARVSNQGVDIAVGKQACHLFQDSLAAAIAGQPMM